MKNEEFKNINQDQEILDTAKLAGIIRRSWKLVIFVFLLCNTSAYLYIRWTKPLYESTSEIKLDIEADAMEFGFGNFFEEKNLSILSGEIELLKSRLFFKRVIDSLELDVGYFTQGRLLKDEKYPIAPIKVTYNLTGTSWVDTPVFINFTKDDKFQLSLLENSFDGQPRYDFNQTIELQGITLNIEKNEFQFDPKIEDLYFIINSYESLQNYFESNLNVELLNLKANTIRISFTDHNPTKARDLVNAINNIYINYTQKEKSLANTKKINWINSQLSIIEDKLGNYEDFFEAFTIQNRTSDLDEDLKKTIYQINRIDSNRFTISTQVELLSNLQNNLKESKIISPSRYFSDELSTSINKFNDLVVQKEQMGLTYKETTFAMQELEQNIHILQSKLLEIAQARERQLQKEYANLNKKRSQLESEFAKIPGKNTEFNKNERFYHLYEEFYLSLMQSKAEFEIAVAGLTPNFKILSPAYTPPSPIYPKGIIVYGVGMVSSFIFSFLFIALKYLIEDKIENVEQIENIVPFNVMGSIPKSKLTSENNRLVVNLNSKSGESEALRTIRTNLQFLIPQADQKTISITSCVGGEGKTFVALNLAAILAMSKKKVIILDLDMRKPQISKSLNENGENKKGMSTILINKEKVEDCIIQSDHSNLFYIPSGPIPPNPSELLLNGEFENLLIQLRKDFDYVILDTPPVGLVTDGILAMKHSDLSLLVVRSGYTRKKDLSRVLRYIPFEKGKISVILNNVSRSSLYGYNYGYYSDKEN
ncbi:MAG: polysaccharide biosynthesis tyrosine autokinase [Cyclobacteriaceae bacterium]|nr:polysaccharide biosynthesis tyrosine autokinase [Cyclobacteriaceae bacterium]